MSTFKPMSVYVYVCVCIHAHLHVHVHVYVYVCKNVCMCMCMRMRMCMCMCMCMCMRVHACSRDANWNMASPKIKRPIRSCRNKNMAPTVACALPCNVSHSDVSVVRGCWCGSGVQSTASPDVCKQCKIGTLCIGVQAGCSEAPHLTLGATHWAQTIIQSCRCVHMFMCDLFVYVHRCAVCVRCK